MSQAEWNAMRATAMQRREAMFAALQRKAPQTPGKLPAELTVLAQTHVKPFNELAERDEYEPGSED